ncbi:MAG: hypothetical protein ACK5BY_02760 [Limnohabitans sp.]|uniref:hypothetical protein n=1 Tax=Limnohabitans sp. TaxID=1907725 RepID=UPI00391C0DB6
MTAGDDGQGSGAMAMQVAEWQQRRIPALAVDRHLRASPYSRSHGRHGRWMSLER